MAKTPTYRARCAQLLGVVITLALGLGSFVSAQTTATWNLDNAGFWNVNANWTPATFPNAIGATALFSNIITANRTVTLGQNITVGTVAINDNNNYTISGANTLTFDATGSGPALLDVRGTGTPTISSAVSLTDPLSISHTGSGILTMSGVISGSAAVTKSGTGTVRWTVANTLGGNVTVDGGTLSLRGTTGTATSVPVWTVNEGDTLALDSAAGNNANRLADTADITLNGGTLTLLGNATVSSSETADILTLASGRSTVTAQRGGISVSAQLTLGSLVRQNGATVNFTAGTGGGTLGTSGSNPRIVFTSAPSLDDGIIGGWATVGNEWATTGASGVGAYGVISGTYDTGAETGWTSTDNVKATGNQTLTASRNINSLNIQSGTARTIALAGFTLNIENGGLLASGANHIISGAGLLTAGGAAAGELITTVESGRTLTISSIIGDNGSGTVGLTKSGLGTLSLSGANTYGGNTIVSAGTLSLGAANAIPDNSAVTVAQGATFSASVNDTIGSLAGAGTVTLGSSATLTLGNNNSSTTFSGVIGGTGNITKVGTGDQTLSGVNTFSGTVTLNAGSISVSSESNLGNTANDLAFGGGTLHVTSGFTTSSGKTFTFNSGGGTIEVDASQTLTINNTAGLLTGTGALTKTGSGTLTVQAANTGLTGAVNVDGGTLLMSERRALGSGALTINNGAELDANWSDAANASTISGITINSGTVRRTGGGANPTAIIADTGTLTVNGTAFLSDDAGSAGGYLRVGGPVVINSGGNLILSSSASSGVRLDSASARNITIAAGGTLTVASTNAGSIAIGSSSARTIIGQGTTASEAAFAVGPNTTYNASTAIQVDGTGLGGLRVEGASANVTSFLTSSRVGALTGSGGTLTFAVTQSAVTNTITQAPSSGSLVKLGFDGPDTTTAYILGSTANDLQNWNGLVVSGGSAVLGASQSLKGTAGSTTTLDLLGGRLILTGENPPGSKTLTIEGAATLSGGVLDGSPGGGSIGTLVVGGNLYSEGSTLSGQPYITMNPASGTTYVTGSVPLNGVGALTKTGAGTTQVDVAVSTYALVVNQGTLLLGGDNKFNSDAIVELGGGTLDTAGYNQTFGDLTLTSDSNIDMGDSGTLSFAMSWYNTWSGNLFIEGWNTNGPALYFGSDTNALTAAQVSQIYFSDPYGQGGLYEAEWDAANNGLLRPKPRPIPEPATVGLAGLLAGTLVWRERRALRRAWWRLRAASRQS